MIHSHLNFDGRPLPNDESYLGCVVKDNLQRGFFIRVVDPQVSQCTDYHTADLINVLVGNCSFANVFHFFMQHMQLQCIFL